MSDTIPSPPPGFAVTCPKCGHEDVISEPPADSITVCSKCRTRVAYGNVVPRFVITPHDRVVQVTMQDPVTGQSLTGLFDPMWWAKICQEGLSIIRFPTE